MAAPIFPTLSGLMYPAKRSPVWDTARERSVSGKATAYPNRNLPLWHYEIGYEFLRSDSVNLEWQTLVGFYNLVLGGAYVFAFTDPDDKTATLDQFGVGDGASKIFQLTRSGSFGFAEPVFNPTGVPQIFLGGVLKAAGVDYTIDLTTGVVTWTVAPGGAVAMTWSGNFNWYCRFDEDSLDFSKFAYQFWELKKVTFTTEQI